MVWQPDTRLQCVLPWAIHLSFLICTMAIIFMSANLKDIRIPMCHIFTGGWIKDTMK